jgi:hypothetical protein
VPVRPRRLPKAVVASVVAEYAPGVRDFFGIPWDDVTIDAVEGFLGDAGDEGLTWEAKGGGQRPHKDAIRKGVCGFANAVGGFFIIGADRTSEGWAMPGVVFGVDEPGTWLSSVITDALRPSPLFDVKVFDRDGGKRAAVVAVEELAVPPCVTASGVVYQRVSGQTMPVTDQRVLADLIVRGRAARDEAEALALRAASRALEQPAILHSRDAVLSVALCPVQGATDKSRVLFSKSFADGLAERVRVDLQVEPMVAYPVQRALDQDSVSAWPSTNELGRSWKVAAYWDGSASAVFAAPGNELYVNELILRVNRAWRVLAGVAAELGGAGAAHLVVIVRDDHPSVVGQWPRPRTPTRRWTEVRAPTAEELGSVEREIQRAFGEGVYEPEA